MSLKAPRFGEVFTWTYSNDTTQKVMYIAPALGFGSFWQGVTVDEHRGMVEQVGEVADRVQLTGLDWLKWSEVIE